MFSLYARAGERGCCQHAVFCFYVATVDFSPCASLFVLMQVKEAVVNMTTILAVQNRMKGEFDSFVRPDRVFLCAFYDVESSCRTLAVLQSHWRGGCVERPCLDH